MILHDEAALAETIMSYNPEKGMSEADVTPVGAIDAMDQPDPLAYTDRERAIIESWGTGETTESEKVVTEQGSVEEIISEETANELEITVGTKEGFLTKTGKFLRGTRVGRAVTALTITASVAGTYYLANTETAKADGETPVCTTSPGGDSTTCVYPPNNQDPNSPTTPDTPPASPDNPPSDGGNGGNNGKNGDNSGNHKGSGNNHKGGKKPSNDHNSDNSQINFPGYNMEDTAFTDHNGCFITSAASDLRRVTGNSHITPRKIYYPALQRMWSPSAGVKGGLLFDALPSIARHFNVKVYKINNARGALRAVRRGDQVQMLAAAPSHFTYGGHYLDARATTPNGKKLILDDPNGKGLHGDSERPSGWSPSQLNSAGIIGYRGLHLIER